ncbi:hypothetical protein [Maridesulfovibrio bastinii]|uniref:hypothetical protein n=1 Tax=Maridesulfovibrio bastinii TaxID=47157 RepID=UPI000407C3FA|nr:hypothetical protein [Maridesulfovibrio bastinii]
MQQLTLFHDEKQEMEFQKMATALASLMTMTRSNMNIVAQKHPVLSRDLIADLMTKISRTSGVNLSGTNAKSIKTASLEKWVTPGARDHPPKYEAIVAFMMVTGDLSPLTPLLDALGIKIMTKEQEKKVAYAEAILKTKRAQEEKRRLEAELK